MWDLPRPGLEPVSPTLAGRFSTTAPPGKPGRRILNHCATREVPVSIFLSVCLSTCLPTYLSICFVRLSLFFYHPSVRQSVCLPDCLPTNLSAYFSIYHLSTYLPTYLSIHLSVSVCLSVFHGEVLDRAGPGERQ